MPSFSNTKFADMPSGVVKQCVAFARSHDWGQNARYSAASGKIGNCVSYGYGSDDKLHKAKAQFSTLREMKNWAGY